MAVQISAPDRPAIASTDPLGGTQEERAVAYASCLAHCGTYDLRGDHIVYRVRPNTSLNWAGGEQVRFVELDGDRLVLRVPPIETPDATIDIELGWARAA